MINNILKKFSIIIFSFIFCFSSASATSSEELLSGLAQIVIKNTANKYLMLASQEGREAIEQSSELEQLSIVEEFVEEAYKECLNLKANSFKDLPTNRRIINLYLNTILDHILASNQDFLKDNNIKGSDLCVLYTPKVVGGPMTSHSLISLEISFLNLDYKEKNDAMIAATLSHELIHAIKRHTQKFKNLVVEFDKKSTQFLTEGNNIFETFTDEQKKDQDYIFFNSKICLQSGYNAVENKELDSFMEKIKYRTFYENGEKTTPCWNYWNIYKNDFKPNNDKQSKQNEIEADNLGLELYLNAGFDPKMYENLMLDVGNDQFKDIKDLTLEQLKNSNNEFKNVSDKDYEYFFKTLKQSQECLRLGNQALKNGKLDDFMKNIQYLRGYEDEHPTTCWRYWNVHTKISEKDSIKNSDIKNIAYLKLDLNKYDFLYNENWKNNNFSSKDSYEIFKEFNDKIDIYNLDLTKKNRDDINFINEKDNTLVLNLYDLVRVIADSDKEAFYKLLLELKRQKQN